MSDGRSLHERLVETVDDIDAIVKQMVSFSIEKDRSCGSMLSLCEVFRNKKAELKDLVEKVCDHRERESDIRNLENMLEKKNAVIQGIEDKLLVAESALTGAVYQAGMKVKSIRQAEAKKVNSEQVIRFANQISKSYSVAAPLFWQLGDTSRPFPTEVELRVSSLAAPRSIVAQTATPALSLLRQPSASTMLRGGGRGSSPIASFSALQQQRSWSPRGNFTQQSSSPRGRGSRGGGGVVSPRMMGMGGTSGLMQRRQSGTSPRMASPNTYGVPGKGMPPPVKSVDIMSSDSSSSSSSDEGSPS